MKNKNFDKNILTKIREESGIRKGEFAQILGLSRMGLYNLEMKKDEEIDKIYLSRAEKYLQEHKQNNNITYTNSIINQNQNNCVNYNNTQTTYNTISINYYQSLDDFAGNKKPLIIKCDQLILQILTNNHQTEDFSKIVICHSDNKNLIIDTSITTPNDKPHSFVIKNTIEPNNTTCFIADVVRNVLNNKLIMKLANGVESEFLNTCTIIGEVINN